MSAAAVTEQPPAHVVMRGEGRPLLLLHGWGASAQLFEPITQPLLDGRALIVPDLPGFGSTPAPPQAWSARDYAAWTVALLDRLEVERCDVIGHSNGGRIAIVMAAEHAERVGKLVLVDSAGVRPRHGLRYHARVRSYKLLRSAERSRVLPEGMRRAARARAERRGSEDFRAASGTLRATLVRLVNEDLTPLLRRIRSPALLIWGERDADTPLRDARLMERLIPDAGLVVFKGAGHYAYLDQPARFVRIVDVFLRSGS
ncbi:MAG: alpha/beta hydrolase [Candidatus Dormibacteraeota bacterium]|nr:alpha/beta hydrolase [Candidatus Dormibacteraeota bacterium]MBV9525607.1 alpha/beta hydrolase [Candidatus Dormibacteraeota bacterium]